MPYDPFQRGDFPVGVRHLDLDDDGRHLPLAVWFPATDAHRGQDLAADTQDVISFDPPNPWRPRRQAAVRDAAPRDDVFPLVIYSHGATDSRFSAGFLATTSRAMVTSSLRPITPGTTRSWSRATSTTWRPCARRGPGTYA